MSRKVIVFLDIADEVTEEMLHENLCKLLHEGYAVHDLARPVCDPKEDISGVVGMQVFESADWVFDIQVVGEVTV